MLLTAKPTQLQLWLPFKPSTLPNPTNFNITRRRIVLNNNNDNNNDNNSSSSYQQSVLKKKNRYRKLYPGESTGITEEMRFVAMRLRNDKITTNYVVEDGQEQLPDTWQPSMVGFIRFLVDNQLVFTTLERLIDDSDNVSFAYLRKTGLERSEGILKDIEWLKQEGVEIPNPSTRGITYAKYLEELAEKSPPLFLSHFYNIHFSHISASQVIVKQERSHLVIGILYPRGFVLRTDWQEKPRVWRVYERKKTKGNEGEGEKLSAICPPGSWDIPVSEKLLKGKELEICKWEGDVQEMLKDVREKLNVLSEVDILLGIL
ncbi:putative inactive heme oxygenase 2 chloroplastic-like [Trifolium pratense]|uniref:Putative inactive heme oxygenase 2 chloroplastic-like n=1 Tax=Trifolium pratense TaxID=57577 RepID=A0A2K3NLS2_TRIPR|nr:putative inactive heme oxygenase 2 chloroplastic-like [Trifolium pratense]